MSVKVTHYCRNLKSFLIDNKGNNKPNCINDNYYPYYIYENSNLDGIIALSGNDDTLLALLNSLLICDEFDIVKIIVDRLILNDDFYFSRSKFVPIGVTYDKCYTTSILLKYAFVLNRLYLHNKDSKYLTILNNIIDKIKENEVNNSDIKYSSYFIPHFVMLYDSQNKYINNYRGGTYTSDLEPLTWLVVKDYSSTFSNVEFIIESQRRFKDNFKKDGLFMPFYSRLLSENSSYSASDEWLFEGPIGDESELMHSYKTAYNLARYYNYKYFFHDGKKDNAARVCLEKFLNYIKSYYESHKAIPDTITGLSLITLASYDVFLSDRNITLANVYKPELTITNSISNLHNITLLALTCLYKFKVDRDDSYFDLCEKMIETLLLYIQDNDSFKSGDYTFTETQCLILELLSLYTNRNSKSYLELINESLTMLNLNLIHSSNFDTNPNRVALSIIENGITEITSSRFWQWAYTEKKLQFEFLNGTYDLNDYDINRHRIESIEYVYNQNLCELKFINYETYQQRMEPWRVGVIDLGSSDIYLENEQYTLEDTTYYVVKGRPLEYAIKNNKLYLYPTPDQDYSIDICYYKEITEIIDYLQSPELLPKQWQFVLKWYTALKLSMYNERELTSVFETMYNLTNDALIYSDASDISESMEMPSNFNLNITDPFIYGGFI